jgi:short-subunit dehydrogenase
MSASTGKTALITGASVGIGCDLAELFARDGHSLVITARNQAQLEELAAKIRSQHGVKADVIPQDLNEPDAAQKLFDQISARGIAIEFLVNNAGFGFHGPFAKSDLSQQLAMLQVNVVALTHLTRLFLPAMLERGSGRIMNVASTAAFVSGPFMAVYYASKAFVVSFSEAIAAEISGSGVTVTALCPGSTMTEFHKRAGIGQTPLATGKVMSSMEVAKIGYDAMMKGKRTVIAGIRNKVLIFGAKIAPRSVATGVARRLNENR